MASGLLLHHWFQPDIPVANIGVIALKKYRAGSGIVC